jgi:hypothetical protein
MKKQNRSRKSTEVTETPQVNFDPDSGGQSGDVQDLPNVAEADSESVEELAEEGQAFEAAAISGVEDAPDPDVAEVTTKEVAEDDVPEEYLDNDQG